jgi:hypothetical protein
MVDLDTLKQKTIDKLNEQGTPVQEGDIKELAIAGFLLIIIIIGLLANIWQLSVFGVFACVIRQGQKLQAARLGK